MKRLLSSDKLWLLIVLAVMALLMAPGLHGDFIFDDYPNLENLDVIKAQGFWNYVLSGIAGGAGRSISYFTFALQASDWPGNPYAFKLVNLLIHILNVALVFTLTKALLQVRFKDAKTGQSAFALLIAFVWGFHPIQDSTVFYVVQRMVLLAATFLLLCGWLYVAARQRFLTLNRSRYFLLTCIVGIGYVGVFAKETGALAGVMVLTLEWYLRRTNKAVPSLSKAWIFVVCVAPILALFVYLCAKGQFTIGYSGRTFTLTERLLTETRVMWDYLGRILMPTAHSISFYNDDILISKSLIEPMTTLLATLGWGLAFLAAYYMRFRVPLLIFALCWFWGNHLLESTGLPLEISFEHRNYLPAYGVIFAAIVGIVDVVQRLRARYAVQKQLAFYTSIGALSLFLLNIVVVGWYEVSVWGFPYRFAIANVADRPGSIRARQELANYYSNRDNYKLASEIIWRADQELGPITGAYVELQLLRCFDPSVRVPTDAEMIHRLETGPRDLTVDVIEEIWKRKTKGQCDALSWDEYRDFLAALSKNPVFKQYVESFVRLRAYSYNSEGRYEEAAQEMRKVPLNQAGIGYVITAARFEGIAGHYERALAVIHAIRPRLNSRPLEYKDARAFVDKLESEIKEKMQEQGKNAQ